VSLTGNGELVSGDVFFIAIFVVSFVDCVII
jgi:hypothetical protein